MCISNLLLSDAPLPLIRQSDEFPSLGVRPLNGEYDEALTRLQASRPAPYAAWVSVAENCGCNFGYRSQEQIEVDVARDAFAASLDAPPPTISIAERGAAQWRFWEERRQAIHSFRRFLERQLPQQELSLYVCWDNNYSAPCQELQPLRPSYFSGPCVPEPPENTVARIVPETDRSGRCSSAEQLAQELIALANEQGLDLTPWRHSYEFTHANRTIRFSGPLEAWDAAGHDVEFVLRGAVDELPSGNPGCEADFRGRWTECGKLPTRADALLLLRAWLIDRLEFDALYSFTHDSYGWALG